MTPSGTSRVMVQVALSDGWSLTGTQVRGAVGLGHGEPAAVVVGLPADRHAPARELGLVGRAGVPDDDLDVGRPAASGSAGVMVSSVVGGVDLGGLAVDGDASVTSGPRRSRVKRSQRLVDGGPQREAGGAGRWAPRPGSAFTSHVVVRTSMRGSPSPGKVSSGTSSAVRSAAGRGGRCRRARRTRCRSSMDGGRRGPTRRRRRGARGERPSRPATSSAAAAAPAPHADPSVWNTVCSSWAARPRAARTCTTRGCGRGASSGTGSCGGSGRCRPARRRPRPPARAAAA